MLQYAKHLSLHLATLYDETFKDGDPRVEEWPLMQSPIPTVGLCFAYVYLVKWAGPCLMKNRQPFDIRALMVIYNFAMVWLSLYLFLKLGWLGWFGTYNYKCQPVDYSASESAIEMATLSWWYYISKYFELCDTMFFVARKKFSHISTLHVIHHGVMPMSVWWGVKFTPGGHSTFFAFINSAVHVIMYVYYGLAAAGMKRFLWWKRYMTAIQMIQFIAIFVHSFQLLFRDCDYPRGFMWLIGFHAVLFWFLFYQFYQTAYSKGKSSQKKIFFQLDSEKDICTRKGEEKKNTNGHCASSGSVAPRREMPSRNGVHRSNHSKKDT